MNIVYKVNPTIRSEELFKFYSDNNICEEGYGIEIVSRVLKHSSLIIGVYDDNLLIATTRSMFDGVSGEVVEFCLGVKYQGENLKYDNGSIVEKDRYGIAKDLGIKTIEELLKMGAFYVSITAFEEAEKDVYTSIGFKRNDGHINYNIDKRPYVSKKYQSDF